MSHSEEYNLVVLGSGMAGKLIAATSASQGQRVAVIERRYVGGSCPNIACVPSKTLVQSAKVADYFRRGIEFGITSNEWQVQMPAVRQHKRTTVEGVVGIEYENLLGAGAELVMGCGCFVAKKTVEVQTADGTNRRLFGKNVVIGTGSRARVDSIPGLAEAHPMTHVEALELDRIPDHLVILGGGYVGLEMAQAFRRFGSRVTIIERESALVHNEDRDVSEALQQLFDDEGIVVKTEAGAERVDGLSGDKVRLSLRQKGGCEVLEGTHLLVATGRVPNTEGLNLDAAGVERDSHGFVKVDERLRTTADGVWAVGDCAGSPHFSHISVDDFRVVRDNLAGVDRVTTGRLVPFCIFTDPELARVGLNEKEATKRGIRYRLARMPVAPIRRAWALSELRGFYKALIAADSDRILGFTAFGARADDVLTIVQLAMSAGLPYTALRDMIVTHPTMAEGLIMMFGLVPSRP